MGMFFPDDPDYFPEVRPRGLARYKQVLEREWKRFFFVDLLTLAYWIPYGLGVGYALLSSSVVVLIPVCLVGGMLVGPGMACMYDAIFRGLRDDLDDWWVCYKKAFRQNFRASVLPGMLMCLFLGFLIFHCAMLWWSARPAGFGTVAVLIVSTLICTVIFTLWWPQIVLFDQKPVIQLKNCLLFTLQNFWPVLRSAGVQLLWWAVTVLFLPWTAFLVPFLGVWYILYVACFLIYDRLDEAFRIEEQIRQTFGPKASVEEN